jgi:pyruvate/2-oxoglutarate/acetoin dehydrogenase E1 component
MSEERVVENLNRGLHRVFETRPGLVLLGEDVADPYGGAFKVTRGLSERFPGRVRGTPISEGALVGVATGLALAGREAVEIMFADFAGLAFDLLTNMAAKTPTMYGAAREVRMIVRTASGARRGYGATHSQSPHKHFVGVPGLSVFEMTPFHDAGTLFEDMLALGRPCILFEDKVLYTRRMMTAGRAGGLFSVSRIGREPGIARLRIDGSAAAHAVIVCTGGTVERVIEAARSLLLEYEYCCDILVPARLHPLDLDTVAEAAAGAGRVFVVEEGTEGGSWAADTAYELTTRLWDTLRGPVKALCSRPKVIPAAPHLERDVILQAADITAHIARAEGLS